MAPSKTTIRSFAVSSRFDIGNNKGSAPNNAEPQKLSPSCLADYFTWPQVALTHHAKLSRHIEPHLVNPVNPCHHSLQTLRVKPGSNGSPETVSGFSSTTTSSFGR